MNVRKRIFMIFTLVCITGAGVSLIVDMAINGAITWSAYPLLSIALGWAVISPLFVRKYGTALALVSLSILAFPFLYFLSGITPVTDWFTPLGIPLSICGLVSLWILLPVFVSSKINLLHKISISVFLIGVGTSTAVNYFIDIYAGADPFTIERILSAIGCVVAAAILGIFGFMKAKTRSSASERNYN